MKKVLKILSGVLFVALLVGTFWFLWRKTRPVKILYAIVQPATDTLKQYVVATGKVQPRDEVEIKPQISGIISDVYKEAGETVRQGEVIATVKVVPEMGQLSSAESRVSVDVYKRQLEGDPQMAVGAMPKATLKANIDRILLGK